MTSRNNKPDPYWAFFKDDKELGRTMRSRFMWNTLSIWGGIWGISLTNDSNTPAVQEGLKWLIKTLLIP